MEVIGSYSITDAERIDVHDINMKNGRVLVSCNGNKPRWRFIESIIWQREDEDEGCYRLEDGFYWGDEFIQLSQIVKANKVNEDYEYE